MKNLLLVDDDDAAAYLFRAAMQAAGVSAHVDRVCDGEDALAFLRRSGRYSAAQTPELIVLDINLPKKDGWAVLSELRKDGFLERIPVVVLSASSDPRDRGRALALGALQFTPKSDDFDLFIEDVKEFCSV